MQLQMEGNAEEEEEENAGEKASPKRMPKRKRMPDALQTQTERERKGKKEELRVEEKPRPGYGVLCPNCDAECPRLQDEIYICINPGCWVEKYDPTNDPTKAPPLYGSSSNMTPPTTWIARLLSECHHYESSQLNT